MNWDKPDERQEWYHNMSSVMQAGPCVRSNQLDYDEDVMFKVCSLPSTLNSCLEVVHSHEFSLHNTSMIGLDLIHKLAGHLH